jgi:mono/diheme cytochrome c family protein
LTGKLSRKVEMPMTRKISLVVAAGSAAFLLILVACGEKEETAKKEEPATEEKPATPAAAPPRADAVKAAGVTANKGKDIFATNCSACHGAGGKGDGVAAAALNPKPRDLTDKAYMATLKDKYLREIIAKGGAAVGKSPIMPAFGANLKEEEIGEVVAFIRGL